MRKLVVIRGYDPEDIDLVKAVIKFSEKQVTELRRISQTSGAGQLVFEDDFQTLNTTRWAIERNRPDTWLNANVSNGVLWIDIWPDFIYDGDWISVRSLFNILVNSIVEFKFKIYYISKSAPWDNWHAITFFNPSNFQHLFGLFINTNPDRTVYNAQIRHFINNNWTTLASLNDLIVENVWYTLKIERRNTEWKFFLNDSQIASVTSSVVNNLELRIDFSRLTSGAPTYSGYKVEIDFFKLYSL